MQKAAVKTAAFPLEAARRSGFFGSGDRDDQSISSMIIRSRGSTI
jgi:hypothetical protein